MTHLAMLDEHGNPATWGEHVTADEYSAASAIDVSRKDEQCQSRLGCARSSCCGPYAGGHSLSTLTR
jgi:hypothetical protein